MPTPTIISSSSFTTKFDLTVSPPKFIFTDNNTYSVYGINIPPATVKDCFTVYAPGGAVVYSNTNFSNPDINLSVGNTNTTNIFIPLSPANQAPINGTYVIVMTTQINDGTNPIYYVTTTNTYNFTFVVPTISINQTVDCIGANFVSTDTTNYVVDGIMPVVVRSHDLYIPGNAIPFQSAGPIISLTSGQFYNGPQQTVISSVCTWTYPDGSTITATITGSKTINVDCTYFCTIYCCLRSINSNIKKYKGVNDLLAAQYEETFAQVMSLVELATLAYSCGKSNDVSGYLAQIQLLADCTSDCSCQDGVPSPVTGLGGGGSGLNVEVVSCGNPLTVTSNTVGNTKTYTLCLDSAFVVKVNNAYNTVVAAGTGTTVADSGIINGVRTFTVNSTATPTELCAFTAEINYNIYPATKIAITNAQASGSLLKNTISATATNLLNPNFLTINNEFEITGFLNTVPVGVRYKVVATPVNWSGRIVGGKATFTMIANIKSISIANNGTIKFSMANINYPGNGIPTNADLSTIFGTVHFIITTY